MKRSISARKLRFIENNCGRKCPFSLSLSLVIILTSLFRKFLRIWTFFYRLLSLTHSDRVFDLPRFQLPFELYICMYIYMYTRTIKMCSVWEWLHVEDSRKKFVRRINGSRGEGGRVLANVLGEFVFKKCMRAYAGATRRHVSTAENRAENTNRSVIRLAISHGSARENHWKKKPSSTNGRD